MGGYTVTPSVTLNPLQMLADPDVRATPSPADRKQSAMLQAVLSYDGAAGSGGGWYGGGWGGNRYEQVNHYRGVVAIAIGAWLRALSACKYTLLRKKQKSIKKSTGGLGNYARDDDYEPVGPDEHPLAKVLECPGGEDGHWSIHQECTYLTLQYLLTGDAPAWAPCNAAGKPVRFYALVSALTNLQYPPGVNPQYPKGAYRVTPYGAGGFAVGGQLGSFAVLPGEEVARLRAPHPWSRGLGMSPLQVGDREIDVLEAITQSRWAMFDHGVQLDAALLMPGLDAEAGKALREQIEAGHGGARHARRFLVLSGAGLDMKWDLKTFGQSSREMDYNTSYDQAAGVAQSLFGVPKEISNFGVDSNYSKDWAAQQRFHDLTISPYARGQLSDFLTQALARRWEKTRGELKIEVEPQVPKNLETESKNRDTGLQSGALDVNEWRVANGYKPKPEGDQPLQAYVQQFAPQPDPTALGGVAGQETGQETQGDAGAGLGDSQETFPDGQETPEATQDAVAQASLAALGVPWDESAHPRAGGKFVAKALGPAKTPGAVGSVTRVKRNEGEVWQSGGKWYTKKNGKIRETAAPGQQRQGAAPQQRRFPSRHHPEVTYGNRNDRDADDRAIDRQLKEAQAAQDKVKQLRQALAEAENPPTIDVLRQRLEEATAKANAAKERAAKLRQSAARQRPAASNMSAGGTGAPTRPQAEAVNPAEAKANLDRMAANLQANSRGGNRFLLPSGQAVAITDGDSLRKFFEAGGRLPPELFAEPAKQVPASTPQAKQTLQAVGQWAASHADRHADRVAQHFGISRDKAHALLVHAMTMVARHAAQSGGQARGVTIRDPRSGKTARLAPGQGQGQGVPRPANPGAAGSRGAPRVAKAHDVSGQRRDEHGRWAADAEIADLQGKLADHHAARADELDALADEAERRIAEELAAGTPEGDSLVRFGRTQVALLRRFARERRELAGGGSPDAGWLYEIDRGEAKALKGLRKAMSSLTGSDGGFLVEPGVAPRRRKGRRAAAVAARVLARLEGQG